MATHHLKQPEDRRRETRKRRLAAADFYRNEPLAAQSPNGDIELHQVYSKGLKHDALGVVTKPSFNSLLKALDVGSPAKFEDIDVGFLGFDPKQIQKLTDPQAGLAFDTEGPDCMQQALPAAPKFASAEAMGEIAENYWMALLRDVTFADYATHPLALRAAAHLTAFGSEFKGPKAGDAVTPDTLFRGNQPGAGVGPYLSQFLAWDVPYGAQTTPAHVTFGFPASLDYLVNPDDYLNAQAGYVLTRPGPIAPLYLRSGREISHYVHIDELFQGYLNACLLMITPKGRGGFGVPLASGNPYGVSKTQTGFGTLGEPNFKVMIAEVATRALKTVWYQKWYVHRRQRPEVFAARIHFQNTNPKADYGLDLSKMTQVLDAIRQHNAFVYSGRDSYLLPMAFPEGSPTHPSYGAGHATVAGACITLLKAIFADRTFADLGITPLEIVDAGRPLDKPEYAGALTVHGELNKLASNVGMGRNIAGVHWRSDYTNSLKLGECIAMNFLRETAFTYNEDVSFAFRSFSDRPIAISKKQPSDWSSADFACET